MIEVNIHPAHNWDELVEQHDVLYEEARQTRLGTEKFMLDGRHTGTGGGNHVVLGGATPADSPFLRRPDLLAQPDRLLAESSVAVVSVLRPVHRPDQPGPARRRGAQRFALRTRNRFPRDASAAGEQRLARRPGWSTGMFRNLLIDVTGNTHRAEFCIDKLYSPDSPTGRLGLVEMRAFEMPPHARMSLAQQLLMRALVARFWQQPYRRRRSIRWGTELHDRFMLPHFVWQDFARRASRKCSDAGYPIQSRLVRPALRVPLSRTRRCRRRRHRRSNCAARSSPGTSSARKARPAAPRATSIRRVERLQVKVDRPDRPTATS